MKQSMGVKINGNYFSKQDFRELIQSLQETAKALKEYREEQEEGKD